MSAFFLKHPQETDLALFAGGESGPFARWRIERHVENCLQCQQIAADFFRLPDQLNGLADLPGVDWKRMAMAIESGVRADAAMGRRARRSGLLPSLAWQAGLVAATVVAAVIVVRQADQPEPEPELVAVAEIEAPAPSPVAQELAPQANEMDVATSAPVTTTPVEEPRLAKATAERQTFASDIAAPAAPPPPTVFREPVDRRVESAAQPVAAAAEPAEARLRSDAAARVGAVSALAVNDSAGGGRPNINWVQNPVGAVNFDDAPLSLLSGYALVAGAAAQTPNVVVSNRSSRTIAAFELVWIAGDGASRAMTRVERGDLAMAPGAVTTTGGGQQWRLPSDRFSTMRVYLSSATFEDGTTWSPTAAQIAEKGLATDFAVQQIQPLDHTF